MRFWTPRCQMDGLLKRRARPCQITPLERQHSLLVSRIGRFGLDAGFPVFRLCVRIATTQQKRQN